MSSKSFQLEKTVPGSFFFQGLAGGLLTGFIFVLLVGLWAQDKPSPGWVIPLTPVYMLMGAAVGGFTATLIWGAYRITRLQFRVLARVVFITFCLALLSGFIYYKWGPWDHVDFAIGVGIAWFAVLPVALLVGSRVKPWELFTFGSIATWDVRRMGSKSVLATLGTLPLRVLSIYALVVWILTFVCQRYIFTKAISDDILFPIPVVYLLASTYLTFRSPRKLLLLGIGIVLNIPTAFLFYSSYHINFKDEYWGGEIPWLVNMSNEFLVVWTIFLVARMCVGLRTRTVPVRPPVVFYPHKQSDHHCLGSRFSEWHERVA